MTETLSRAEELRNDLYEIYDIEREFDITIEGLTVESSLDKLNKNKDRQDIVIISLSVMEYDQNTLCIYV